MQIEVEITPGMAAAQVVDLAKRAEAAGIERLGISDVLFYPDSFQLQTACALATNRILIGPVVTNPYSRHPVLLAAHAATLQDLSSGRAFLGLGIGAGLEDIAMESVRPARAMREALVIIRQLLAGKATNFDGEVFQVTGNRLVVPPEKPVPLSVGSRSERVLGLAGEFADIALVGARYWSKQMVDQYLSWLKVGADRAGRSLDDIEFSPRMTLCVSEDGAQARSSVKRYIAHYLALLRPKELNIDPELVTRIDTALEQATGWYFDHDRFDPPELEDLIVDDLVRQFAIAGTPDECAVQIAELSQLGFTGFSFNLVAVRRANFHDGILETVEGFAKILPTLRRELAA